MARREDQGGRGHCSEALTTGIAVEPRLVYETMWGLGPTLQGLQTMTGRAPISRHELMKDDSNQTC
jgi:hypothetical protein